MFLTPVSFTCLQVPRCAKEHWLRKRSDGATPGCNRGGVHLSEFVERISTAISRKPLIWCIIYAATNQSVLKRRRLSWRLGKKPQGPIAYRVKQAFPTNWKRTHITLVPYYWILRYRINSLRVYNLATNTSKKTIKLRSSNYTIK